ncbi:hypothetical protein ABIB00_007317 [Bradyrhizobium sp. LB14.3]
MSRPEFSEAATANPKQATTEAEAQMARAKERAASFLFGAQKLMLEECVILGNEFLDRTQPKCTSLRNLPRNWPARIPSGT